MDELHMDFCFLLADPPLFPPFFATFRFLEQPLTPSENGLWGFRRGEAKIGAPPASSVDFWLNLETKLFYLLSFSFCT